MTATTATKLLIGVVIFVGMPLLAWGWADVSGFFANWARFGYVVVALILQVAIVVGVPDSGNSRGRIGARTARDRMILPLLQFVY